MAFQYEGKSPGATPQTRTYEDEKDWNPKMDDVDVTSRELDIGTAISRYDTRKSDPLTDLKARLSTWPTEDSWGKCSVLMDVIALIHLDPNFPEDKRESQILDDNSSFDDEDIKNPEEDSPYPEVRAAVHNYDEDVPANTIRAWTIGMILVVVGASMNTLFSLRAPSIGLGALVAQIIAWPMGHGWARVMPTRQFNTFGLRWSLNPGPFNIKEHSIIVVMASVSFSAAYATDILLAQLSFYKQDFGIVFQLLLVISTQSVGYGIAGMMRKFLV